MACPLLLRRKIEEVDCPFLDDLDWTYFMKDPFRKIDDIIHPTSFVASLWLKRVMKIGLNLLSRPWTKFVNINMLFVAKSLNKP